MHVEFSEAGGVEGARQVLTGRATGVYASSLAQAIGVLHGARELGISVPADVSVIGNDDFPIAGYLAPPLTTVAMPLRELGRSGVDVLVNQLEGREPEDLSCQQPSTWSIAHRPRRRLIGGPPAG